MIYQNVEDEEFNFIDDTFVARAFKPLSKIFELMRQFSLPLPLNVAFLRALKAVASSLKC